MENNIVIPHNPFYYKRYVDDIINRRKKHEGDFLFKKLNNYHPKTKLTIEINPPKFLNTEIIILNNEIVTSVHKKESKLPVLGNLKFLSNFTMLKRYPQISEKKLKILKKNFVK